MEAFPRYLVLGPLLVRIDGELRAPSARKQRLLLTRLLLSPNEVVSIDRLLDALWGDSPPGTARKLIQLYIHELRGLLGEQSIETAADGYSLHVDRNRLDSTLFERLADEGRTLLEDGNADLARTTLRRALDLWRGPAFGDAAYEDFARVEAERLEELRLASLEARVSADAATGAADAVELLALVQEHPEREGFRGALMTALYRAGRQTEALEVYEQGRMLLDEQLGLEPSPRLRELQRQILTHDPALDAAHDARPSAPPLPVAPTPLLGRNDELEQLSELVGRPELRLLTIVGAGGIGKSRLALELAHLSQSRFANGTYLVELAKVRDTRHVAEAILEALGGSETADVTTAEAAGRFLGERELLLVLDNVEHLATIGDDLAALVRRCPRLTVVVTSRRVLHLSGEHVFPVAPLDIASAIELFRTRAEAAAPGGAHDEAVVGEICRRLDNLPLAIELAAARTATLTAADLLERLHDRLGLLVDGPRDLPDRQRTLRETLRWSGSLLGDGERDGLARLGVFAGGCSLEAAEAVAGVSVGDLHTLIAHSLVNRTILDGRPRFGLHETVREYALELLGRGEMDAERRHATYFADLAGDYYEFLVGPDYLDGTSQNEWLKRLDGDAANMRAAFDWSVREEDDTLSLRLVAGLWRYRHVRGQLTEGLAEAEQALALDTGRASTLTAVVRAGAAGLAFGLGRYATAVRLAREAIAAAPDDQRPVLTAENVLGVVATQQHDYETATEHLRRVHELAIELGSEADEMTAVFNLGEVAYEQGEYETATENWAEFLTHWRERGSHEGIGLGSLNLGLAALRSGQLDQATDHLREALTQFELIGFRQHIGNTLLGQAAVRARRNDPNGATFLLGSALKILEDVGAAQQGIDRTLAAETEASLRAMLGDQAFEEALERGRELGHGAASRDD